MNPRRHASAGVVGVAAVTLLAVAGLLAPSVGSAATPLATYAASDAANAAFLVDDAQLTWGVNDESNNRAFAPGTFNFLSAGTTPDPGSGGQNVVAPGVWRGTRTTAWWAEQGEVRIEKRQSDGSYAAATFAGLSTDASGQPLRGTNGPTFSDHRVVVDGGTGQVDPEAGTATIRWTGSFSVLYYSGFSLFTVTDPVLQVTPTSARVRATLSGYASSREDASVWGPVPPRTVVLADLPRDAVDLTDLDARGFTAQPAYLGVRFDTGDAGTAQVRDGAAWGAFPTSFLRYLERVGSAAFWYSTGGAADRNKIPQPLTISYSAGDPVEEPVATDRPQPSAEPTTTINPPPPPTKPPTTPPPGTPTPGTPTPSSPTVAAPVRPAPPSLPAVPGSSGPVPVATAPPLPSAAVPPPAVYALSASSTTTAPGPDSDHRWTWWLGSALLLGAAALTLHRPRAKGST